MGIQIDPHKISYLVIRFRMHAGNMAFSKEFNG